MQWLAADRSTIGAGFMAWGKNSAGGILIKAHRMTDQALQQGKILRQRCAVGVSPVQPGVQAALMLTGQRGELIGIRGTGMGQKSRPGCELVGNKIDRFIQAAPLAIGLLLLKIEVVDRSIAALGRNGELQRPFMGRRGRWRREGPGFTAIDGKPVWPCARRPAGQISPAYWSQAGIPSETNATKPAQLVVTLSIEAQGAAGQFPPVVGALLKGPHHHSAATRW